MSGGRLYVVVLMMVSLGHCQARHKGEKAVLSCAAEPAEVVAGEAVTLSARGMDLPDGKRLIYQWSVEAGTTTGDGAVVGVDTKRLVPGSYTADLRLVDGKRVEIVASCATKFAVAVPDPPMMTSCVANRAAIHSGDPVTITAVAHGAEGTTLSYSYASTNGQVTGNGASALLATSGATPGAITVTCTVTDDFGRAASATASVVVATPAAAEPAAATQRLCELLFERDRRRPDRVDNEAKGCLDEVALDLERDAGARLAMTGHHDRRESAQNAAVRAMNAKEYLTREKGIDGARVRVGVSDEPGRSVETLLIPAGVNPGSEGVTERGAASRRVVRRRHGRRRRSVRAW